LIADVRRRAGPVVPTLDDGVLSLFVAQVGPGGEHLGDHDRHRGVIGPFARLPSEATAAHHGDLLFRAACGLELVRRAQSVTRCGGDQHPAGPIDLCRRQLHVVPPFALI